MSNYPTKQFVKLVLATVHFDVDFNLSLSKF